MHSNVRVASKKEARRDEDKFGIQEEKILLYIGVDIKKKKSPAPYVII